MSERKSFDLERKRHTAAPAAKKRPTKAPRKETHRAPAPKKSLRRRREDARKAAGILIALFSVILVCGAVSLFWVPAVRITAVNVSGMPDPERVKALVKSELDKKYFGILPHDSIFFYPERSLKEAVLLANPGVKSISISRDSFDSISLRGAPRQPAFFWCGVEAPASLSSCYEADADGFVFARAEAEEATTSLLRVFGPLDSASSTAEFPLSSTVVGAMHLPNLLEFVEMVEAKSVPVAYTSIQADEASLYVTAQTSIRYVLGQESSAAALAAAAFPTLNLMDGSIEYVDLRFPGKAYVKRRMQESEEKMVR